MRLTWLAFAIVWIGCSRFSAQRCRTDADCQRFGGAICDQTTRTCWTSPPDGSVPDLIGADLTPMSCTTSADCTSPEQPICGATHECRSCVGPSDNADCAAHDAMTPRCDADTGQCAACRMAMQDVDCDSATPICSADGSCQKCSAHAQCSSGVCKLDGASAGACAAASEIAYVDNKGVTPMVCAQTGTHDGSSPATAFCDVQAGVDSNKPYVLVAGHLGAPYSKLLISSSKVVSIIGPGQGVAQPATIYDATNAGVAVSLTGAGITASVTLDGMEIGDRTNVTTQDGVLCSAASGAVGRLTVRRTTIQRSGKFGVNASGCDVTCDGAIIGPGNGTGGIILSSSDATIVNSLIDNNGTTTSNLGGVGFSGTGPTNRAQLINSTIVENTAKNQAGVYSGIDCTMGAAPVIFNTVVNGNSNGQINAACSLTFSAYAGASGPTNTDLTNCSDSALFMNPGGFDFRPKSTPTAPCGVTLLGKGTTALMSIAAPDHDLTSAARPQPAGSMPDIGAYEEP